MPRTRMAWAVFTWVGLAWLALAAPAALAQERQELSLGAEGAPVTVFADRIENNERERLLIAEGHVEVEQEDTRLEADRVEVNTETGEAVATGRIVFFDGRDRLVGQRLEYNFRAGTGIVYQGQGLAEPHFFFGGQQMQRFGQKAYRLTQGVFTTCEGDAPAWHIKWGQATAYLDDYIWGTNASFWVWKVPLVPLIPFFAANLRRERQTGFLMPTFGQSSTKGFEYAQPFYWAISDSQDLTLLPTYYSRRGFALGGAYRYLWSETSRGQLDGTFLRDGQVHEDRWIVGFRHEEQITPRLTLKADVARVSDQTYLSEFGGTLDQRTSQRIESNISLTQRWDKWNFVGRLFDYQDLTTTEPIELRRLPELTLNAFQQPVPGVPGLLYQLESSYDNFVREIGSAGQRLDAHPQLSYPFSPGGFFTLTPRAALRETVYDTKVIGTKVDHGFTVEDTRSELVTRTLFEGGADLEARAFRVFDMGGAFGIQRLQHVIEPRVSYDYLNGDDNTDELPQWDAIDAIRPSHIVTYSLTNRLKARAVGEEGKPGRVWEVARLTLSQSYNIEPTPITSTSPVGLPAPPTPVTGTTPTGTPGATGPTTTTTTTTTTLNRLSDLQADLILEPVFGVRFRGTAAIDPYERRFTSATTDASYEADRWRVSFGTVHGETGHLQFVRGDVQARIGTRWLAHFSTYYNVDSGTVIENRFEVSFREQCWGLAAALIDRTNETEFNISINLLELGQYGFARAFTPVP